VEVNGQLPEGLTSTDHSYSISATIYSYHITEHLTIKNQHIWVFCHLKRRESILC